MCIFSHNLTASSPIMGMTANSSLRLQPLFRSSRSIFMQVLLRKSDEKHDLTCSVCGQGFRLYWERPVPAEQEAMRATVQEELRQHHSGVPADLSPAAHPASPFNVPSW